MNAECLFWKSNIDWPGLKTANDRFDFKMKGFRHCWWKKCLHIHWDPDGISHLEALGFFAFSLQIPIVYSAARGRVVLQFWQSCKLFLFWNVITRDWVHLVNHFPVFLILLQIEVRISIIMSWPLLLLGLILLAYYPLQLTFPSSALWLLVPPLLVE